LHIALDRDDGTVLGQQLEEVTEQHGEVIDQRLEAVYE